MVSEVVVTLPERTAASVYPTRRKPMASVEIRLNSGASRRIALPVRVARLVDTDALMALSNVDRVLDSIFDLEKRVCFSLLSEMLSRRDYATREACEKLRTYGFRDDDIQVAITKATSLRYMDDERFARYFIDERKRRGWGRIKIEQELKRRGVDPSDLPGYPEEFFSSEDDFDRAFALLSRKAIPEQRAFEKLVRFLLNKGFSYSVASSAVRQALAGDE